MITKAAFLLFRMHHGQKELLFAQAKGKPYYVFPGGKQETGETIEQALQRELQEELGAQATGIEALGVVDGSTPDGRSMRMHLYGGQLLGTPQPHAEIERICWMGRAEALRRSAEMTPMTLERVLPYLEHRDIW